MIRATYRKSASGYDPQIRATVASLGFRRLNQVRELPDNEAIRGMLRKVSFLVAVEGEPVVAAARARYKTPRTRSAKKHARGH